MVYQFIADTTATQTAAAGTPNYIYLYTCRIVWGVCLYIFFQRIYSCVKEISIADPIFRRIHVLADERELRCIACAAEKMLVIIT